MSRVWILVGLTCISTYLMSKVLFAPSNQAGHSQYLLPRFTRGVHILLAYHGVDFPWSWNIDPSEKVHMLLDDSVHYDLGSPRGIAEWKSLFPPHDGAIRLGPDARPFGLSMFHELACVDTLRDALVSDDTDMKPFERPNVDHCMNYLRQAALCRGDLTLQNLRRVDNHVTDWFTTYECKDWSAVYDAIARNQKNTD
jgi:hypothetical protein